MVVGPPITISCKDKMEWILAILARRQANGKTHTKTRPHGGGAEEASSVFWSFCLSESNTSPDVMTRIHMYHTAIGPSFSPYYVHVHVEMKSASQAKMAWIPTVARAWMDLEEDRMGGHHDIGSVSVMLVLLRHLRTYRRSEKAQRRRR